MCSSDLINERLDGFRIVDFVFDLRHDAFIQQFFVVGDGIGEIQDNGLDTFAINRRVEIQRQARLGSRALLVLLIIIDTVIVLAEKIGIWTTRIELFIKRIGLCCIFFITRLNLLGVLRDGSSLVFSRLFGSSAFFCRFLLIVASTEQRRSGENGKRQLILFHRVFLWLWVKSQGDYNDSCVFMGIRYGYFSPAKRGKGATCFMAGSERGGEMEGLPDAVQVGGSEGFGMQHQAWCGREMIVGIEFIAEDGVADGGEVDAQLVAAAGVRGKGHAAIAIFFGENLIAGVCVFAVFVIDFLPGAAFPIGDERVVDVAAGLREDAMDEGDVAFCDAAFGKLLFVMAFGGLT